MTRSESKLATSAVKEVLGQSPDLLRELIREVVQDRFCGNQTRTRGMMAQSLQPRWSLSPATFTSV